MDLLLRRVIARRWGDRRSDGVRGFAGCGRRAADKPGRRGCSQLERFGRGGGIARRTDVGGAIGRRHRRLRGLQPGRRRVPSARPCASTTCRATPACRASRRRASASGSASLWSGSRARPVCRSYARLRPRAERRPSLPRSTCTPTRSRARAGGPRSPSRHGEPSTWPGSTAAATARPRQLQQRRRLPLRQRRERATPCGRIFSRPCWLPTEPATRCGSRPMSASAARPRSPRAATERSTSRGATSTHRTCATSPWRGPTTAAARLDSRRG